MLQAVARVNRLYEEDGEDKHVRFVLKILEGLLGRVG